MNPGASIIIVTFNSIETIADCLISTTASLRANDEILIIDNNSQDNTLAIVEEFLQPDQKKVRVFPQKKNLGFSRGCNVGIENSDKEFVILLNPDTQVFGDWIKRLTGHFKIYPKTGAVGPLSNQCLRSQQIQTYFPNYKAYYADAFQLLDVLQSTMHKRSLPKRLLMGFCLVLRRDLIEKLGPLDEDIFLGIEDVEMSWRLRENGYSLRVALDVFINHQRQTSFKSLEKTQVDKIIQESADVLFAKMQEYYKPAKVPHPRLYFNIDWWQPSILKQKSEDEVFDSSLLKHDRSKIIPAIQRLLKSKHQRQAIELLEETLNIIVDDHLMWYTLGSLHLINKDFEKAEIALKNAWAYVETHEKAQDKLWSLFSEQGRDDEAIELFGDLQRC
ncbi:MAG: glycosyltransferase [Caldithrix sp.]|nr:MAG: glycosyltransferase [Caldithrix sp.]